MLFLWNYFPYCSTTTKYNHISSHTLKNILAGLGFENNFKAFSLFICKWFMACALKKTSHLQNQGKNHGSGKNGSLRKFPDFHVNNHLKWKHYPSSIFKIQGIHLSKHSLWNNHERSNFRSNRKRHEIILYSKILTIRAGKQTNDQSNHATV